MVAATTSRYRSKASVPFCCQLAREFKVSRSHMWRVCTGLRQSRDRDRYIRRQAELLREAAAKAPARPFSTECIADAKPPCQAPELRGSANSGGEGAASVGVSNSESASPAIDRAQAVAAPGAH